MKKHLLWLLMPVILLVVLAPAMGQAQQRPLNGDFETWTNGAGGPPDNWRNTSSPTTLTMTQESATVHGGTYSNKLSWTGLTETNYIFADTLPIVGGQSYTMSIWVYDNDSNARARLWYSFNNGGGSGGPTTYSADNASWVQYTWGPIVAPVASTKMVFQYRTYSQNSFAGAKTIYIDDAVLTGPVPPSVGAPVRVPTGDIYAATDVSVHSLITDSDGTIASESLYIDLNGGGYNPVESDSLVGNDYWFHVGTNSLGTKVIYYAVATDDSGARTVGVRDSFTVINILPVVGAPVRVPAGAIYAADDVSVHSLITDSNGTIASESLYIDLDGGGYNPVESDSLVGDDYWFHIGTHVIGTVVTYYAVATDNEGGRTVGSSDTYTVLPDENVPPSVGAPVRVPAGPVIAATDVSVNSLISDPDGTIASDSLYIDLDGAGYNPVAHDSIDAGGNYWFHIGAHAIDVVVTYYAVATDDDGARTVGSSDSYTVANSLPIIGIPVRLPAGKLFYDHNVTVHASITDLDGTIDTEMLQLQLNGGGYNPIARDSIAFNGDYWYTIGPRAAGTVVDYYITATDNDDGSSQSATYSYTVHGTVPISLIQHSPGAGSLPDNCYPTDSSNTVQQITGIVVGRWERTATYQKRFFVQDSQDPWSGLYVYNTAVAQIGDSVTIRGVLIEYYAETELNAVTSFTIHSSGHSVTPTVLTCPEFPPDSCSALSEPYEGMFIQMNNLTLVRIMGGADTGDFWAFDGSGDSSIVSNDLSQAGGVDSCVFEVGHTYTWIRGVARYAYGRYRLMPRKNYDLYTAPGTIAGIVFGPDGQTPLSGVSVTTLDAGENVVGTNTSGPGGAWTLDLPPGTYHETLTKAAYVDTFIVDIVVTQSATTNVSVLMRLQEIVCNANNIFTVKFATDPGVDPNCWPSPRAGQIDSVCGIVTAIKQGASPRYFLQDQANTAWGGIYGYDITLPDATPVAPQLGDYIQVASKVSEYYGWTELDSLIGYKLISHNQPLPDTTVVTISTFTPNVCSYIAEPFESELVRFNNVTVRSAQGTLGNYWITDLSTGDSIRIATDLYYLGTDMPDPAPATGYVYSSIVGVIRWEGRTSGSNIRGWILLPRFASDCVLFPAPELVYVYPLDETRLAVTFNRGMNPGTISNPANYSTFNGLSIISAAVDPPGALYPRKAILTTAVQPGNTIDTLIANGLCDSAGVCMTTPHKKLFHSGFTTIAYIQTPNAFGDSTIWIDHFFTTKGVCTSDSIYGHYNNYFMTDQSGPPYQGIHLYFGTYLPRPVVGDTFIVTGRCIEFNRETELQDVNWFNNVQVVHAGPAPIPAKVAVSDLWTTPEYYESDLVTVCDSFIVTNTAFDSYGWLIRSVTNPADSLIINKDGFWTRYTYVPVLGDTIKGITGIYRYGRSKWRLSPRLNDDFNSFNTWCVTIPTGTIAGIVYEHDGVTPLEGVTIVTADGDDNIVGTNTSGIDGTWTLDLPVGSYHENLSKDGFVNKYVGGINVTDGGITNVSAIMRQYGSIHGIVTDGANPLEGVTIVTLDPDENPIGTSTSGIDGTWTLPIEPGTYHERLTKGGYQNTSIDFILVTDGATTEVDAVMVPLFVPNVDHFDFTINAGRDTTAELIINNGGDLDIGVLLTAIPTEWLSVAPGNDTIPAYGSITAVVTVNSSELPTGVYTGSITLETYDLVATLITIPVNLNVVGPVGCQYVVGDANGNDVFNGLDVSYGVAYFKGGPPPPYSCSCPPHGIWFVAGDVNASCSYNGLDVTYAVAYFKGGPGPHACPDCLPTVLDKIGGSLTPIHIQQPTNGSSGGQ